MPYMVMLSATNLTTLVCHRAEMSRKFFLHISQPTSCLHHLPDTRDHLVISRLRTYKKYPNPRVFSHQTLLLLYTVCSESLPERHTKLLEPGQTTYSSRFTWLTFWLLYIGSRPSDHYFRSVCWFICLCICFFVCAEFFSVILVIL